MPLGVALPDLGLVMGNLTPNAGELHLDMPLYTLFDADDEATTGNIVLTTTRGTGKGHRKATGWMFHFHVEDAGVIDIEADIDVPVYLANGTLIWLRYSDFQQVMTGDGDYLQYIGASGGMVPALSGGDFTLLTPIYMPLPPLFRLRVNEASANNSSTYVASWPLHF